MKHDYLESVRAELDKCVKCASCQAGCFTYELSASETLNARGKIRLAQGVLEDELKISPRLENDFSKCLSCMNCVTACPSGVDTMKIFSATRAVIQNEKGSGLIAGFIFRWILPYPGRLNLLAKIVGLASIPYKLAPKWFARFLPFSPDGVKRVTPDFLQTNLRSIAKEINEAKGEGDKNKTKRALFFSGCMTDLAFPETGLRVIEKLGEAGLEVIFPEEQTCCGAPTYYSGDMETSKMLAKKNIDAIMAHNPDYIVYSCATCGSVLGETYPKLFAEDEKVKEFAGKVIDFQKLMFELNVRPVMELADGKKLKVTYHDPCHLKRGMGVHEEPREFIKSLPNVKFVEMEGADRCCGGSGTFALKHYDMSIDIGKYKALMVKKSGADIVVTACPSCQLQLTDSLNRFGVDIPVAHTADLLDYAMAAVEKAPSRKSYASKE